MSHPTAHSFHLVDESPWPLLVAVFCAGITSGAAFMFYNGQISLILVSGGGIFLTSAQWWRDVAREGASLGNHTPVVELGLRWGMVLFIISEVFLFMSFFWAYFHSCLVPAPELGGVWPPGGIVPFDPLGVPLLNSVVLLSSGVSVTWSHHSFLGKNFNETIVSLGVTICLGGYFTCLQKMEYNESPFDLSDGVYGSSFFMATGFHGAHVIVGTLLLGVALLRLMRGEMSPTHCFGFEAAAWYWHFVDVVWLFLYVSIYWWGPA